MKKLLAIVMSIGLAIGAYFCGRNAGIATAITADGFLEENENGAWFILDVDGNYYVWNILEQE